MNENKLKIKFNISYLKWILTGAFLLGNLALLLLFEHNKKDDIMAVIYWEISVNCLAVLSFIMLSIFPRWYYFFDEKGVSFQDRKGKEKFYKTWDEVISICYLYSIIPEGLEIKWGNGCKEQMYVIGISPKQAKEVYNKIPQIKSLMDSKKQ